MIFFVFVITIILHFLPNFSARLFTTPTLFLSGRPRRCKSMMILVDCLRANLILFSRVRLLLPSGDFISHSKPMYLMSGVWRLLVAGMNSTSSPVQDKIVATLNSCGCTNAFFGTVMCPILLFRFFITLFYHLRGRKTLFLKIVQYKQSSIQKGGGISSNAKLLVLLEYILIYLEPCKFFRFTSVRKCSPRFVEPVGSFLYVGDFVKRCQDDV